jgi:hypothetical protein
VEVQPGDLAGRIQQRQHPETGLAPQARDQLWRAHRCCPAACRPSPHAGSRLLADGTRTLVPPVAAIVVGMVSP